MGKTLFPLIVIALFSVQATATSTKGLCNFNVDRPKSGTIGDKIVRGPWTTGANSQLKYRIEIGDKSEADYGLFPSTVIVLTNKSVAGCSIGSPVTATGNGVNIKLPHFSSHLNIELT